MHVITQTLQVSHSSIHTTWVVTWAKPKACWRKYHKALRFAKCDLDRKEFQSRWIIKEFLYDLQREKLKSVRRYDGFGWLYWLRTTNITKFNLEENCYYQQTKGKTMHVDILYRHLFCTSVGFFFSIFQKVPWVSLENGDVYTGNNKYSEVLKDWNWISWIHGRKSLNICPIN